MDMDRQRDVFDVALEAARAAHCYVEDLGPSTEEEIEYFLLTVQIELEGLIDEDNEKDEDEGEDETV